MSKKEQEAKAAMPVPLQSVHELVETTQNSEWYNDLFGGAPKTDDRNLFTAYDKAGNPVQYDSATGRPASVWDFDKDHLASAVGDFFSKSPEEPKQQQTAQEWNEKRLARLPQQDNTPNLQLEDNPLAPKGQKMELFGLDKVGSMIDSYKGFADKYREQQQERAADPNNMNFGFGAGDTGAIAANAQESEASLATPEEVLKQVVTMKGPLVDDFQQTQEPDAKAALQSLDRPVQGPQFFGEENPSPMAVDPALDNSPQADQPIDLRNELSRSAEDIAKADGFYQEPIGQALQSVDNKYQQPGEVAQDSGLRRDHNNVYDAMRLAGFEPTDRARETREGFLANTFGSVKDLLSHGLINAENGQLYIGGSPSQMAGSNYGLSGASGQAAQRMIGTADRQTEHELSRQPTAGQLNQARMQETRMQTEQNLRDGYAQIAEFFGLDPVMAPVVQDLFQKDPYGARMTLQNLRGDQETQTMVEDDAADMDLLEEFEQRKKK